MLIAILIFSISLIALLGMVSFQAWKLKTSAGEVGGQQKRDVPELYFRHVEKIMLHFAKHAVQWIILTVVKYWFILHTKIKNWGAKEWPKVYNFFSGNKLDGTPKKHPFMKRTVLELKHKIRHTREKVREEHGNEQQ